MQKKITMKGYFIKLICAGPKWLQNLAAFLYFNYGLPIGLGPITYAGFYVFAKKFQWSPAREIQRYQTYRLKYILRYAGKNVPYYRDLFKKINFIPERVNSVGDLKYIPVLSREEIINHLDKFVSRKINRRHSELISTSGSTGKPMQFYRDRRDDAIELALTRRWYDTMGLRLDDKNVYLSARRFIEKGIKDTYLYEPHLKRLSLSSFPHSLNLWAEQLSLIRRFEPKFVRGNPSMLYNLANYAKDSNISDIRFEYFISYFENLFPYQRELISSQFHCEVYNYYVSEERIVSAFECPRHNGMHINMERGILEIAGDEGQSLPAGYPGRIVVTGFYNFAMPFIRYDIGDLGSISEEPCPCGRGLVLLKTLDGRANEAIRYKDKVAYAASLSTLLWRFKNIKECQFVQECEDKIKVNIIKREGFSTQDTSELIGALKDMIDERLNISVNFVDYIPRTNMGKFPFVVSNAEAGINKGF